MNFLYMTNDIAKKLKQARPPYSRVNPLGFWISIAFIPFNTTLAYYLLAIRNVPLVAPHGFLSVEFWSVFFFMVSVYLLVSLVTNSWEDIRRAMMCGLIGKAFWMYAILYIATKTDFVRNLYLIALWGMVTFTQVVVVVYFLPESINKNGPVKVNGSSYNRS